MSTMFARIAVLAIVALLTFARPSSAAPTIPGSDPNVMTINRHLAALVEAPAPPRPVLASGPRLSPAVAPAPTSARAFLLSPAVLSIASGFTKAERLLHFQGHGLDANLWGAFNGGRGVRIRYVIRF